MPIISVLMAWASGHINDKVIDRRRKTGDAGSESGISKPSGWRRFHGLVG